MTRGIGTRLRQSGPGGGGLRFGGIWTVLIVMQVAVMAIVPTPVIAIYGDVAKVGTRGERRTCSGTVSRRDDGDGPREGAWCGRLDVHGQIHRRDPGARAKTRGRTRRHGSHGRQRAAIDGSPVPSNRRRRGERRARKPECRPPSVSSAWVALDFFDVLDAPILSGRAFHSGDLLPGARTVIVNQSFAQVVFGGSNPIGRRLRYTDRTPQNPARSANEPVASKSWASCGISA